MKPAAQIVRTAILGLLTAIVFVTATTTGCKRWQETPEEAAAPVSGEPTGDPTGEGEPTLAGEGEPETTADEAAALQKPEPEPEPKPEPINTNAKVAILGYHRFSESAEISKRLLPTTIHIEKFRAQMQTLVDNEIPVISLSDFLAWRRGEKNIPSFSIIITIDDGWKSTYTLALPVLREFGFPFTIYLYSKFLNGGGKTLTYEQIYEMVDAGGEIGSHSVSHQNLRTQGRRTDEMQLAYLKEEVGGSRRILREKLGIDPVTFSYPYGVYNDKVIQACEEAGYEAMLTVRGRKAGWKTDLRELGRYIVHGEDDRAFDWAVSTRMPGGVAGANNILKETVVDEASGEEKPLVAVSPAEGSTIGTGRPIIEADLSRVDDLDADSLVMMIGGLGEVRAQYDAESRILRYQPVQRLRRPSYWVQVRFRRAGKKKPDIMRWKFSVDPIGNYLESIPPLKKPGEDELENPDGNEAAAPTTTQPS